MKLADTTGTIVPGAIAPVKNKEEDMPMCVRCHKPLTDLVSITAKMGPVCRLKGKSIEGDSNQLFGLPKFSWQLMGNVIVIIDHDQKGYPSVTNSVGKVLDRIKGQFDLSGRKIIYRDSMGIYDGINHKDGEFIDFYSVNEVDLYKALKKIQGRSSQGRLSQR